MRKIAKQKELDGRDPAGAGDGRTQAGRLCPLGGRGNPLASVTGREWLAGVLAAAEHEETHGPCGGGWLHNESLRAGIVERAEFLRALVSLLKE